MLLPQTLTPKEVSAREAQTRTAGTQPRGGLRRTCVEPTLKSSGGARKGRLCVKQMPTNPQRALCGGIPSSFLEPSLRSWSHFVGIYRQN